MLRNGRQIFFLLSLFVFLCLLSLSVLAARADQSPMKMVRFSGYEWDVKESDLAGPGPNQWDAANVWVDAHGWLHLKISHVQGKWRCAELVSRKRFGFGRYQFQVTGLKQQMDRQVVLGLFNYPPPEVGPDGTNEIDIEFAHWADPATPLGNFTVCPAEGERPPNNHQTFPFVTSETETTHRLFWNAEQVFFQSLRGHRDNDEEEIAHWTFASPLPRLIPHQPLPIHINLWLFRGKPPVDLKEVEIVVRQFTFIPRELLPAAKY